jgi:REP element-mobilizing transposase RayT
MRDFDTNEFPLAYLITFRCYGTWLHGDDRGSYRRTSTAIGGVVRLPPRPRLRDIEVAQLKHPAVQLNKRQRHIVEDAIREVCLHRKYTLYAVNARTNHAHSVVSGSGAPEPILAAFKSYSTRALREAGLGANIQPWSRHGSTVYLWKEQQVNKAIEYVMLGQDHPFSVG